MCLGLRMLVSSLQLQAYNSGGRCRARKQLVSFQVVVMCCVLPGLLCVADVLLLSSVWRVTAAICLSPRLLALALPFLLLAAKHYITCNLLYMFRGLVSRHPACLLPVVCCAACCEALSSRVSCCTCFVASCLVTRPACCLSCAVQLAVKHYISMFAPQA
jgi:hypothetical protein